MEFLCSTIIASLILSFLLAPVGCLVVWRGISFIGEALSHGALLGVALAHTCHTSVWITVWCVSLLMVVIMPLLERYCRIDTVLACWMYVSLGLALWLITEPHDGMLWGDISKTSKTTLALMGIGTICVLSLVARYWRLWLWYGLQSDVAKVEKPYIRWYDQLFWAIVATVTALSCQSVGTLLVPALLVLPASAIRPWVYTPQHMMYGAILVSITSFGCALPGVFYWSWPIGPSVVVILGLMTVSMYLLKILESRLKRVL